MPGQLSSHMYLAKCSRIGWDQQAANPAVARYGFRLVCQCAANLWWELFRLDLNTAFLERDTTIRSIAAWLFGFLGLPPWMVQ